MEKLPPKEVIDLVKRRFPPNFGPALDQLLNSTALTWLNGWFHDLLVSLCGEQTIHSPASPTQAEVLQSSPVNSEEVIGSPQTQQEEESVDFSVNLDLPLTEDIQEILKAMGNTVQ